MPLQCILFEISVRIHLFAVQPHLEMKMVARRAAGLAHFRDFVATLDDIALLNLDATRTNMAIQRPEPVTVINYNTITISPYHSATITAPSSAA